MASFGSDLRQFRDHGRAVPSTRISCILILALCSLPSCGESGDGRDASAPSTTVVASPSPKIEAPLLTPEGGSSPSGGDLTEFLNRPIKFEHLSSGAPCPVSAGKREVPKVAITIGDGPVYAVPGFRELPPRPGGVVEYENGESPTVGDRYPVKVLWAVDSARHSGPIVVRGAQLDGQEELLFQIDGRVEAFLNLSPSGEGSADSEWRYHPSAVLIRKPGCYGFQVDGPELSQVMIFKAVP